ncbi:MAG: ABC transporter permease [Candidatus Xenobia bacterium]
MSERIGGAIIALFLLLAVAAPLLTRYDPIQRDFHASLQPPSAPHWFGTDKLGRDVFTRVAYGARISLRVGIISVGFSLLLGVPLGAIAGYCGGRIEAGIEWLMGVMLAFPSLLLALVIVAVLGPGVQNAMIAVGIVGVPIYARLVRSTVLSMKEREFVLAARVIGASDAAILIRHILPNCLNPVIVQTTLGIATAIVEAAGLGFLGLGAQPPAPEWGKMLADSVKYFILAPWTVIFPGLAIAASVLGFNLLGEGLRESLDPSRR